MSESSPPDSALEEVSNTSAIGLAIVYAAFLGAFVSIFFPLLGVIGAYVLRIRAPHSLLEHLNHLIKTFWFALMIFAVLRIISITISAITSDMGPFEASLWYLLQGYNALALSGHLMELLLQRTTILQSIFSIGLLGLSLMFVVWYVRVIWKGLKSFYLGEGIQ